MRSSAVLLQDHRRAGGVRRHQDKMDAVPIMNVVAQSTGNVYGELCVVRR
jgi:hypothetical protein